MHSEYSHCAYSEERDGFMNKKDLQCDNKHNKTGRFIEACLLCLLKEEKAYGYSLMERLSDFGFKDDTVNMSVIYRNLKNMEKNDLIVSSWEESEQGPDRRIYSITPKGDDELDSWIVLLKDRKQRITSIISKYEEMK